LKNPSILVNELKAEIKEIEDEIKNGSQALLDRAKDIVNDVGVKVAEAVAKGKEVAQCVNDSKAQIDTLARQGGEKNNN
jgi:hypothetical protein